MSIRNMLIGAGGTKPPGAPTSVSATAGNSSASVSFTAPADNGGSAITGYRVTASPGGATATGSSSPITVSGLSNGTAYTFTVAATNAIGYGAESSPSASVTPTNPELYAFTTVTFTNAGQVGPDGPTITQARSAIGNPSWAPSYLNMTSQGIQLWTVPATATYRFEIAGASSVIQYYGGNAQAYGRGAKFTTDIALTYNTVIKILCGQLPSNAGGWTTAYNGEFQSSSPGIFNGGGGATYVATNSNTPLAVAGGGGSQRAQYSYDQNLMNARQDFNSTANPGGAGNPGSGGYGATSWNSGDGSGGAGFYGDAYSTVVGGYEPARAFINGGRGAILGSSPNNPPAYGGFGGGGHGGWGGSGGGGGYSGGGTGTNDGAAGYGGGGSNFNSGTLVSGPSQWSGAGYVKVTKL